MHSDRLFFSIALFKIDLFKCIPRYAVSVTYHIEKLVVNKHVLVCMFAHAHI